MYFSGNEENGIAENEWQQNLYLAESADGFHYTLKGKVMDALIEQSVCRVKDKAWPYRLIGNQMEDGRQCMFLWKSKDGIAFTGRKLIHPDKHDTQNVLVPRGRRMKLYSRVTQEGYKNRRMTVAEFTLAGSQLSATEILAGDFLYNNAACAVDDRYDLLFDYEPSFAPVNALRLEAEELAEPRAACQERGEHGGIAPIVYRGHERFFEGKQAGPYGAGTP